MEKPIKISIITPSFNQSEYIDRTIKSVLDQDYLNLEYIIMDGGSNDGTIDVIKKYEPRLAFWKSEKDRGQVNAINNGLNQSTGEIVGWLNSDDVYKEGTLSLIADYFEFNPEVDIVYGNSDIIDAVDNKIGKYISETPSFIKWAYKGQIFVSQPSLFFRRRVFDTLGLLDESLPINFDHDYWFRALLNRFHMEYVNKTFSSLRWHTETISFKATGKHRHLHLLILRKNKILAARVFYYIRYIILVGVKKKLFGDIKLFPKRINVGDQFFTKQAIGKKRVLFVHQTGMLGGSSNALLDILSSSEVNKICPIVVISKNGPIVEHIRSLGIRVLVFRLPILHQHAYQYMKLDIQSIYSLMKWLVLLPYTNYKIAKLIWMEHIDLVHLNSSILIGSGISSRLMKVPVIYHIREYPSLNYFGKYFYKCGAFVATTIFCASESIYKELGRITGNVTVVSDWVDVNLYNKNNTSLVSQLNVNHQASILTIGMVSLLIPGKGIYIFLEIARKLLDQSDRPYKFLLVGGFSSAVDEGVFWNKVNALGLSNCIHVTGWTKDVPNWLIKIDIVVVPNKYCEGFGKSLIEAASMEKAIVASNLPPTNLLLQNGQNCLLVEPTDINAFVTAIKTLSNNDNQRKKLGFNARLHVIKKFSKQLGVERFFNKIFGHLHISNL